MRTVPNAAHTGVILIAITLCAAAPPKPAPLDLKPYRIQLLYSNDFDKPQHIAREEDFIRKSADGSWRRTGRPEADSEWIAEGQGGVEIRNGRLRVAPSPFDPAGIPEPVEPARRSHMVVWNRHVFPADFLLEFEMSPDGSRNGLAIVFFCAAAANGRDIFDLSLPPRRADYPAYHSGAIANYSDSFWSRNTQEESVSNRLRKNPGFQLVAEGPSGTTGSTGVTHHVRILKYHAHVEVEIDGNVIFKWDDPGKPLGPGRIGLRSMSGVTTLSWGRFKIWKLAINP